MTQHSKADGLLVATVVALVAVPAIGNAEVTGATTLDPNDLSTTAILTFNEEFDTFQTWNGVTGWDTKWSYAPAQGTRGYNNELQWYIHDGYAPTDSVVPWSTKDGVLHITAAPADASLRPHIDGAEYTSGMINSFHSFAQTYGYFEMRAALPAGQGLWPAFWMLPVADRSQEIDIMEVIGQQPTVLYTSVHSYATGSLSSVGNTAQVADMSAGFHTYGLHWTPETLTYFFDGKAVFSTQTPADMHEPMFLIANLAVGGTWPGRPDATTSFPASMRIDYIRAYADPAHGSPVHSPKTLVSITAVSAAKPEGTGSDTPLTFTVIRTGDTAGATTVDYLVTGWAEDGTDAADFVGHRLPSGTVSFVGGETSKTVTIVVNGDNLIEANEGFTIDLHKPSVGATIEAGSASGNVLNDDVAGTQERGSPSLSAPTGSHASQAR